MISAQNVGLLLLQIAVDAAEARRDLTQFTQQATQQLNTVADTAQRTGGSFSQMLNVAGGTMLAQGIQQASGAMLNFMGQAQQAYAFTERLGLSLQAMAGREMIRAGVAGSITELRQMPEAMAAVSERAQELQGWMEKLAIQSPFNYQDVASSFRMALTYGFTTTQAQRLTKAMSDFSAGTGQTGYTVQRMALALGQVKAKGKIAGQEINQLSEAGVNVRQILADAFNKPVAEIMKMTEKGLIPADQAIEAIVSSMERDFGSAAADSQNTMSGMVASLEDLQMFTSRDLFSGVFKAIGPYMSEFIGVLTDPNVKAQIKGIGEAIGTFIVGGLDTAKAAVIRFKEAFDVAGGGVQGVIAGIGASLAVPEWVAGIGLFMVSWAALIPVISGTITLIMQLGTAITTLIAVMSGPIGIAAAAIVALGLAYTTNFLGFRDLVQPAIDNIVQFGQAIGGVIDLLKGGKINPVGVQMLSKLFGDDAAMNVIKFRDATGAIFENLRKAGAMIGTVFQGKLVDAQFADSVFEMFGPDNMAMVMEWAYNAGASLRQFQSVMGEVGKAAQALGTAFQGKLIDAKFMNSLDEMFGSNFMAIIIDWAWQAGESFRAFQANLDKLVADIQVKVGELGAIFSGFFAGQDIANFASKLNDIIGKAGQSWNDLIDGNISFGDFGQQLQDALAEIPQAVKDLFGGADFSKLVTGVLDWGKFIPEVVWPNFIVTMTSWGQWIKKLDWGKIVATLADWAGWIPVLTWSSFVAVLGWLSYIVPLEWGKFIEAIDWLANNWVTILNWDNFIAVLNWGGWVVGLVWNSFIDKLNWLGIITPMQVWDQYIKPVVWPTYIKIIDWIEYVKLLVWSNYVKVLEWGMSVKQLTWNDYVKVLDWFAQVKTMVWENYVKTLDWFAYVKNLDWGGYITGTLLWANYVVALTWSNFVATMAGWATWVQNLDWGNFIPTLVDWIAWIPALLWDAFITAVMLPVYVTKLLWEGFITAINWLGYVVPLAWGNFVSAMNWVGKVFPLAWSTFISLLDWKVPVQPLTWNNYVSVLDWLVKVPGLVWSSFITAFTWVGTTSVLLWNNFIPVLKWLGDGIVTVLNWAGWIGNLFWSSFISHVQWTGFITPMQLWDTYIAKLPWIEFITAKLTDWSVFVGNLNWDDWLDKLLWPLSAITGFDWSTWVKAITWPLDKIGAFDWGALVPDFTWPTIPAFPGWTSFASFLNLPGSASGQDSWRGGLTWVGEKGPELLNLPKGTQIFNNKDSIRMVEALGNLPGNAEGTTRPVGPFPKPAPSLYSLTPTTAGPGFARIGDTLNGVAQEIKVGWLNQGDQFYDEQAGAMEAAAAATQAAFEKAAKAAQDTLKDAISKTPGVLGRSPVTEEQMAKAKAGIPQNFADDWLRHLNDEVLNNVNWDDADIKDAALRAGLDPNLPKEIILGAVNAMWEDSSLFAGGKNLDLINQKGVAESLKQQQASASGEASLMALFGITPSKTDKEAQDASTNVLNGLIAQLEGGQMQVVGQQAMVDFATGMGTVTPEATTALTGALTTQMSTVGATGAAQIATTIVAGIGPAFDKAVGGGDAVTNFMTAFKTEFDKQESKDYLASVGGNVAYYVFEGWKKAVTELPWANQIPPAANAGQNANGATGTGDGTTTPPGNARGTPFWHGGYTVVGEEGPELVSLPRGSRVWDAGTTASMLGGGDGVTIQTVNINNGMDVEQLGYRLKQLQRRRGK